jgi:maltoporin
MRMKLATPLLLTVAFLCPGLRAEASSAAELEALRQEIRVLRTDYEDRISKLESRLEGLVLAQSRIESEAEVARSQEAETREIAMTTMRRTEEAIASAEQAAGQAQQAQLIAESLDDRIKQIATTPFYDAYEHVPRKEFEFHGYLRSGFGINERGGQQIAFKAPGAPASYRLGNEAETYAEMIFVNNWVNKERDPNKARFKTEVLVMAQTDNISTFDPTSDFRFREAFGQAGNILPGRWSDSKFWAGQRYYMRQQIYTNDFWYTDMSGYGGGVEDVPLGFAKGAMAWIGSADPTAITAQGNVPKRNLDARIYDFKVPGGRGGLWYNHAFAKVGELETGEVYPSANGHVFGFEHKRTELLGGYHRITVQYGTANGHAFGFEHKRTELLGGYHRITVQYGTGAASNLVATVQSPTAFWQDAKTFLVTDHTLFEFDNKFSVMPAFAYGYHQNGTPDEPGFNWFSFGAQPVYHFTDHISLAFDAGFDWVKDGQGQYQGWLRKFTIPPQLVPSPDFWSMPSLRGFVTFANWSDGLQGFVGGDAYKNRK